MLRRFAAAAATVGLVIPAVASGAVLQKGAGVGCPEGQQGTFACRGQSDDFDGAWDRHGVL
jgi:hypothetical protein